jgi:hypothetical protein
MAVLQNGIECDAVTPLRQILADRRQAEAMAVEPAEYPVVLRSLGQDALGLAHDGFHHRPDAAAELECIATHEAA